MADVVYHFCNHITDSDLKYHMFNNVLDVKIVNKQENNLVIDVIRFVKDQVNNHPIRKMIYHTNLDHLILIIN